MFCYFLILLININCGYTLEPSRLADLTDTGSKLYILLVIIAAGVVLCAGPELLSRTSSIVQIIFFFRFCDQ